MCGDMRDCLYRNLAMCEWRCMMAVKNLSLEDEERQTLLSALDLVIASGERRSNRAGETQAVKDALAVGIEKARILKNKLVLTK